MISASFIVTGKVGMKYISQGRSIGSPRLFVATPSSHPRVLLGYIARATEYLGRLLSSKLKLLLLGQITSCLHSSLEAIHRLGFLSDQNRSLAAIWWPPLLPPRQVPSLSFGEDAPGSHLMQAFLAPVGMRSYGPANLAIPPRASRYEPGSRHGIHPVASFSFSLSLNDVGLRQGNGGVSRTKPDRESLSIRTFVRNVRYSSPV